MSMQTASEQAPGRAGLTKMTKVEVVVPDERADALLIGLRALLEASSGVMFASDTYVSRPEHFR